jgi:hypothetical protein
MAEAVHRRTALQRRRWPDSNQATRNGGFCLLGLISGRASRVKLSMNSGRRIA